LVIHIQVNVSDTYKVNDLIEYKINYFAIQLWKHKNTAAAEIKAMLIKHPPRKA